MATARVLPEELAQWWITISSTGTAAPPDLQGASNDSVAFRNTAAFPVNIVFTDLFTTLNVPAGQPSAPLTPPAGTNTTINYTVFNANNNQPTGGPYAIEFGHGPMEIDVAGENPMPATISIPVGGQIQFDSDASYPIGWNPANVLSPEPATIGQGLNPLQTARPGFTGTLTYTVGLLTETQGRGTVKIGS